MIDPRRSITDLGSVGPVYQCGMRGPRVTMAHGERYAVTRLTEDQQKHAAACLRCRTAGDALLASFMLSLSKLFAIAALEDS